MIEEREQAGEGVDLSRYGYGGRAGGHRVLSMVGPDKLIDSAGRWEERQAPERLQPAARRLLLRTGLNFWGICSDSE